MSIDHLEIKTSCAIWRNVVLPQVNRKHLSPAFYFDESVLYFELSCSCSCNSYSKREGEEEWSLTMNYSDKSKPINCVIIPYAETAGKYVRLASTIERFSISRSSLSNHLGSEKHVITMLFLFARYSLNIELYFKEWSLQNLKTTDLFKSSCSKTEVGVQAFEGKESIQSLCLEGLSEDIAHLFNNDEYADTKLVCGNKSFSVHRNILTARSKVFSSMFKHDMSEKNSGIVDIVDLDPNILEQFLRYLYSGKVEHMTMDAALELYKTADKYAVSTLIKECASYILENMSEDLVYKVLLMSSEAGDMELLNSVASYAGKIKGFLKSTEWEEFALKFPDVAVKVYLKYLK